MSSIYLKKVLFFLQATQMISDGSLSTDTNLGCDGAKQKATSWVALALYLDLVILTQPFRQALVG